MNYIVHKVCDILDMTLRMEMALLKVRNGIKDGNYIKVGNGIKDGKYIKVGNDIKGWKLH